MKLFKQLDANCKSAEENWQVLNRLDRKITITRMSTNASTLTTVVVFYLYLIAAVYGLLASPLIALFANLKEYAAVVKALDAFSVFKLTPLPWYGNMLLVAAGVFVIPLLATLLVKLIALLISTLAVKEKTDPLPSDTIARARALWERTNRLYYRQYHSTGVDLKTTPSYIGSVLFAIAPLLTMVCLPETRALLQSAALEFDLHIVVGWLIVIGAYALAMLIPSVIFWFVAISLELALYNITLRLHLPKKWHPRCQAIDNAREVFYKRLLAVDEEERKLNDQREQEKHQAWEREKKRREEFIHTMAGIYLREQKEHEEYRKRLHEWATDGDDPKPGCGDGI